jgi:hypothetical protein
MERERLGHDAGNHTRSWDVRDRDVALLHLLADQVLCQARVTSVVVELRVARQQPHLPPSPERALAPWQSPKSSIGLPGLCASPDNSCDRSIASFEACERPSCL